jgi:hypothetical protein
LRHYQSKAATAAHNEAAMDQSRNVESDDFPSNDNYYDGRAWIYRKVGAVNCDDCSSNGSHYGDFSLDFCEHILKNPGGSYSLLNPKIAILCENKFKASVIGNKG